MTSILSDLQQHLEIDKTALDDEVMRQPSLFYKVSEALTDALAERDGALEELSYVDAEQALKGRKELSKAGAKVTDAMVKTYVQVSVEHDKAFNAWLQAKARADKLQALKEAFNQRSYMLRDLVTLYSANYYESTSVKPTRAQEASHYANNRARISTARALKQA